LKRERFLYLFVLCWGRFIQFNSPNNEWGGEGVGGGGADDQGKGVRGRKLVNLLNLLIQLLSLGVGYHLALPIGPSNEEKNMQEKIAATISRGSSSGMDRTETPFPKSRVTSREEGRKSAYPGRMEDDSVR